MQPLNELSERFDPITADWTYIRWLGDRKGMERITTTWDKTAIDRTNEMSSWVDVCYERNQSLRIREQSLRWTRARYHSTVPRSVAGKRLTRTQKTSNQSEGGYAVRFVDRSELLSTFFTPHEPLSMRNRMHCRTRPLIGFDSLAASRISLFYLSHQITCARVHHLAEIGRRRYRNGFGRQRRCSRAAGAILQEALAGEIHHQAVRVGRSESKPDTPLAADLELGDFRSRLSN